MRSKIMFGILLFVIVVFTACSEEIQNTPPSANSIDLQMKEMTLEEKIGQMVIVGLEGYTIDNHTRTMIDTYQVGGFILYGSNVESSGQLLTLINSLKSTNSKNKVPLFVSVDEEGGRISRLPNDFEKLPSNKAIGDINNSEFSYFIGSILAEEVKSFGFNMNFAPVLDINSNPKNPVIGDRSFGSDVEVVRRLGIQTMKGIQSGGVIPVVKHFPGHGDTSVDSHVGLPTISNDMDRLESFELIPFIDAINNGADVVMTAHILLNKIDLQNPSSLSNFVATDLLRNQLNFNGVVITDDLTMGAIAENYSISEAAVKAVNAGNDIVLVSHGKDNALTVLNALKTAVEDEVISEARIDEGVYRILKLKDKYNLTDNVINSIDIEKINNKVRLIKRELLSPTEFSD